MPCPDATSVCPSSAGVSHRAGAAAWAGRAILSCFPCKFQREEGPGRAGVSPRLCMAREGWQGVFLPCCACRGWAPPPAPPLGGDLSSSPPSCSLQPQGFTTPCFALEQDSVFRTEPGEAKELPQALPIAHTPHCHRVGDPSPKIHFTPGPCWECPAHPSPSPAAFSISVTAPWTLLPLRAHTSLWQPMEGGGRGWFPIFSDVIKPQSTADRNPQSSTGNCQIPPR